MPDRTSSPDDELLLKLNVAVAAANEVEKTVETAKAELVSQTAQASADTEAGTGTRFRDRPTCHGICRGQRRGAQDGEHLA